MPLDISVDLSKLQDLSESEIREIKAAPRLLPSYKARIVCYSNIQDLDSRPKCIISHRLPKNMDASPNVFRKIGGLT